MIHRPVRTRAGTVNLVNDHNGVQTLVEGFLRNKTCLGHRPFGGIHHQQDRIDHRQDSLNFATKVSVTGRVYDVDPVIAPPQTGVFGQNGDATLFFLIVRVHDTLGVLVFTV